MEKLIRGNDRDTAAEKIESRIHEEQQIVNTVVDKIDGLLDRNSSKMELAASTFNNMKDAVSEAYGVLVDSRRAIKQGLKTEQHLQTVKSALYKSRLILHMEEEIDGNEVTDGKEEIEIISSLEETDDVIYGKNEEKLELLVGEHECRDSDNILIYSWMNPVCRNYVLSERTGRIQYKDTIYALEFKRDVVIMNKKVVEAIDRYPEVENGDESAYYDIADPFLRDLQRRRGEKEFSNIIFSIQKQQTNIVLSPYDKNIIVQGCAGSGKSMIMLHRLPIILYDNAKFLSRTGISIITPSKLYINMVRNMMVELEIDDLNMEVLSDYYLNKIHSYERGIYSNLLPKRIARKRLDKKIISYVYSEKIIEVIREYVDGTDKVMEKLMDDVDKMIAATKIRKRKNQDPEEYIKLRWRKYGVYLSQTVREQRQREIVRSKHGKEFHDLVKVMAIQTKGLVKNYITELKGKQYECNLTISKIEKVKGNLVAKNGEKAATYKRYLSSDETIYQCNLMKEELQQELVEFTENSLLQKQIEFYAEHLQGILDEYIHNEKGEVYILDEEFVYRNVRKVMAGIQKIHFAGESKSYHEVQKNAKILLELTDKLFDGANTCLLPDQISELERIYDRINSANETIVPNTYKEVIGWLQKLDESITEEINYDFTYYLFLQIIFAFQGPVTEKKDNMVVIDEAQNLSATEYDLINKINDGVILNLYGDINQHVEYEKGLNDWSELINYDSYNTYYLNQNYRNVEEVTTYCNERFGFDMVPVSLPGKEVRIYGCKEMDLSMLIQDTWNSRKENYKMAVIVQSIKEDLKKFDLREIESILHKVRAKNGKFDYEKVNVIEVEDAKGLEFEVVIVLNVFSLTENERYIAFTRALDELILFDCVNEDTQITAFDESVVNSVVLAINEDNLDEVSSLITDILDEKDEKDKGAIFSYLAKVVDTNKYGLLLNLARNNLSNYRFRIFIRDISKWLYLLPENKEMVDRLLEDMDKEQEEEKYRVLMKEIQMDQE